MIITLEPKEFMEADFMKKEILTVIGSLHNNKALWGGGRIPT